MTRELLFSVTRKDFRVDTFRSGGKGGQNQNKRDTGVRIVHIDSGAVGESREQRHQLMNKKIAFRRLLQTPEWKAWLRIKTSITMESKSIIEERISSLMEPRFIKIEVHENGKWIEVKSTEKIRS